MNLSLEDEEHAGGLGALFKEHVAGVGNDLLTVASEPKAVFNRQAIERTNAFEGLGDFFDRGGRSRRDDGGGKHPGPPVLLFQDS